MKLLLATQNLHKVREFKDMLKPLKNIDIYSLRDFPEYTPPPEDGHTFEENASKKATHAAKELKMLTLSDDSGLVVPLLNNKPGIHSARYAGPDASDLDNRQKLLHDMKKLSHEERAAYFECCICLATEEGLIKSTQARLEGMIMEDAKGSHGFGYDPIFVKYDYNKSLAELEEKVKNMISHRCKALDKMLPTLEKYI